MSTIRFTSSIIRVDGASFDCSFGHWCCGPPPPLDASRIGVGPFTDTGYYDLWPLNLFVSEGDRLRFTLGADSPFDIGWADDPYAGGSMYLGDQEQPGKHLAFAVYVE